MHTRLLTRTDPARAYAEQMVRGVYREAYGARIAEFPPLMAAVLNDDGVPVCAAGLRTASSGFFSECYLDCPVEESIFQATREMVSRECVLEVTTLAAVQRNHALKLVHFVIEHGRLSGSRWGLFTATAALRRALIRAGLALHPLALALPERVANPASWGSYYETLPRVCAVSDPRHAPAARVRPVPALSCRGDAAVA